MGRYAIFNGLVYGGGTAVIPNPEGTPTDELHSIQIGDDIYEIVGGGGSGGNASLDATTLYDTPITSTGTYTLADDYNNYDFIGFKAGNGSTETDIRLYAVKDIQDSMNDNLVITNNVTNSWFNFTINADELTIPGKTVSTIYSVIGYKIKGGGSTDKVTKVYDAVPSGDGCSIVVAEHIWLRDSGGSVSYSTAEYPDITSVDNFIARLTQTAMDDGSSDYNTNITFTFDDTNKTIEMSWGTLSGSSGCYVDIVYSLVEPVVVASDVEISNTNTVTYDISSIIPTYQTLASKDFMFNLKHIYSDNDGLGTSSPFNINFNSNTGVLTVSWNDIGTNNVLTGDILLLYKEDGYKLIRDMQPPTETSSGYHGYVPAPKIGDENKFLRGDGTWSEGGGSSNVEANPTGTPTDTLNTIGIDGTIYDIKGSGGGDGYKLEKIFDGNVTTTGNITLNKSISNYDELLFVLNFTRELGESYITTFNVDVSIFKNIGNYTAARGVLLNDWSKDSRFAQVKYVDDTTIDVEAIQVVSIVEIYGVKLEGSGGSGSQELISYDTTITTTQYGWWTAEDKDGNTLDPDQYELIAVTPIVNNSPSWVGSWDGAFFINTVDGITHRYDVTFVNINDGGYIRTSRTWDIKVVYRDKNAAGGGGGSTVVPNPQEEPTDMLNTVEIDGVVYGIEGGSEGGQGLNPANYSTEEEVIGVWTNNLPVYKKTWTFSSAITVGSSSWADTSISVSNTQIHTIVNCEAVGPNGQAWTCISATTDEATQTYVRILNTRDTDVSVKHLTLYYIKNGDSPIVPPGTGGIYNFYGMFVDTNNEILPQTAISSTPYEYTATENCFVGYYLPYTWANDSTADVYIDNVKLIAQYGQGNAWGGSLVPLKKGQVIKFINGNYSSGGFFWVYGATYSINCSSGVGIETYSTTEEYKIGKWIDGKTLYQKTLSTTLSGNQGSIDVSSLDIDNGWIVDGYYDIGVTKLGLNEYMTSSSYTYTHMNDNLTPPYIDCKNTISADSTIYVTIKYTKNTEITASAWTGIGTSLVDYSTSEKIVGTWLDGSSIYQKTFVLSSPVVLTSGDWTVISEVNVPNADASIYTEVFYSSNKIQLTAAGKFDNGVLSIFLPFTFRTDKVTVRYTKTTT